MRGFRDIYGEEWEKFEYIVSTFREILKRFNVVWMETPVLEPLELFVRSVGEFTDIVQKQMFSFKDRGGRGVALRPEGTAGVVRAFVENNLNPPIRVAYYGPMFRAERPQKGRYRQFYQVGVEFLGFSGPFSDAEGIIAAYECVRSLGINAKIYINTLGSSEVRIKFSEDLRRYLSDVDFLCDDCRVRREKNPLRVLDCKVCSPKIEVPDIMKYIPDDEAGDFKKTLEILSNFNVPFERDFKLVRGLDYYTGVVFEIKSDELESAQNTVLAGGRYDNLVRDIGGRHIPAFGWAAGVDRIALITKPPKTRKDMYFVVRTDDRFFDIAFGILMALRGGGKVADMVFDKGKSLKSQMRRANKMGARWVIFVGEEEVRTGKYKIKDMDTGEVVHINF